MIWAYEDGLRCVLGGVAVATAIPPLFLKRCQSKVEMSPLCLNIVGDFFQKEKTFATEYLWVHEISVQREPAP